LCATRNLFLRAAAFHAIRQREPVSDLEPPSWKQRPQGLFRRRCLWRNAAVSALRDRQSLVDMDVAALPLKQPRQTGSELADRPLAS
jgi:hypothetical protein